MIYQKPNVRTVESPLRTDYYLPWSVGIAFFILNFGLLSSMSVPTFAQSSMPNSSRECAICHIRWVDTLVRNGSSEDVMETVRDRQAGSGDMCLSCHDGSVVDSRFKVWSTSHHTTDSAPSSAVKIPTDIFPLDEQGRMTCATCHTAHAVRDSSDLKTVVFLRQPNIDSSLCLACHGDHAQKNSLMHPLGRADKPVPQVILDAGGKTSADGHMVFCQTCHEPHGATNAWMLVLPPSKLCIACHTDKAPETKPVAGAPVHSIGHTYPGFEPPGALLEEKATFGPNGELGCLSCHRLHDASGAKPLLIRKNEDSSLCLECHKKEDKVIGSRHDLRLSSPDTVNANGDKASTSGPCGSCHRIHGWAREVPETNRPHSSGCMECHSTGGPGSHNRPYVDAHAVGTALSQDMSTTLPLDSATKSIGCLTCHDPHYPRASEAGIEETDSQIQSPRSFLRHEGSQLCTLCHDEIGRSRLAPHDPVEFAPAVREELGLHPSVGPCRVCHTTHNAQGPHLWTQEAIANSSIENRKSKIENVLLVPSLCGACHQDKLGVRNSVHDPGTNEWASELDFTSKGSCLDCHPVHGKNEKESIWASLVDSDTPAQTCENCHRPGGPGKVMETPHMGKKVIADSSIANRKSQIANVLKLGSDRRIVCTTCHDIHQEPQSSKLLRVAIGDLCGACHQDKLAIQDSAHDPGTNDWADKLGFVSQGACIDCHRIHGPARQGGIWEFIPSQDTQSQLCQTCHRAGAPGKAVETPHVGKILARDSENLPLGDQKRILCTSCHDIHQKAPGAKLRASRQDSSLCLACHSELGGLLGTSHDLRASAPAALNVQDETAGESGPCGSCHTVHRNSRGGGFWAQGSISRRDFGKSLCICCHRQDQCGAKHIPKHTDHPEVALLNRTESGQPGHMPTFDVRGEPSPQGAISCLTCHDPHTTPSTLEAKTGASERRNKFLRPVEQRQLCADCHGIEALWRFLYYHKDRRNPHPEREMNPLSVDVKP